MNRFRVAFAAAVFAVFLVWLVAGSAPSAAAGQGSLRAQLAFTQRQIPRNLTERTLWQFFRRNQAQRLAENATDPIETRFWQAEMITAFNRAPGDLEFHVLWYDIGANGRQPREFVADMSTLVNDRTQRSFVQRIRLSRERGFKPNRYVEAVVTVRRQETGRARIALIGEEPARSGRVEFTDQEAR